MSLGWLEAQGKSFTKEECDLAELLIKGYLCGHHVGFTPQSDFSTVLISNYIDHVTWYGYMARGVIQLGGLPQSTGSPQALKPLFGKFDAKAVDFQAITKELSK